MIKIVNEALSSNLPRWIGAKRYRSLRKVLSDKGIDLHNATYVPDEMISSGRDKRLKDPNRLQVFIQRNSVFIPGVYSGDLFHVGDDFDSPTKFSWRDLAAACDEYGYIDLSNPENTNKDIRQQRAKAKSGSIDRGEGQYKQDIYNDWRDEEPSGYKWVTTKGQDKSGYALPDPDKYVKMLNSVNKDNYGERLEKVYNKVLDLREDIHNLDIRDMPSSLADNVFRYFSDVVRAYKDLTHECERAIEHYESGEYSEEYLNMFFSGRGRDGRRYNYGFPYYVVRVEDEIKATRRLLAKNK